MPVYIIRAGDTDFVKIGWATSPETRCTELQTGNHEELKVIRLMDGGRELEAWLHLRFAPFRVRSEWFRFDAAMLTIECPTDLKRLAPANADPVLAEIEAFLTKNAITATAFGVRAVADPVFVHGLRRGREVRRATLSRVIDFMGRAA